MIRVTIELLPFGSDDPAHIRHLGTAFISNDGTGTDDTGHYNVKLTKPNGSGLRVGRVEGFARLNLTAWDLLFHALKNVIGERNA